MNDLKENFTVDFDIDYKNDDEDIANNLYQSYFLKFFKLEWRTIYCAKLYSRG